MRRSAVTLLSVLVITGCMTTSSSLQSSVAQDPNQMVGSWHGWLIKPSSFGSINLDIRNDRSFELSGDWGIQSSGLLVVRDGKVRFDGSRAWRGTLVLASSPRGPVLKLERDDQTEHGILHLTRR
jgi:hypothetical protein